MIVEVAAAIGVVANVGLLVKVSSDVAAMRERLDQLDGHEMRRDMDILKHACRIFTKSKAECKEGGTQ